MFRLSAGATHSNHNSLPEYPDRLSNRQHETPGQEQRMKEPTADSGSCFNGDGNWNMPMLLGRDHVSDRVDFLESELLSAIVVSAFCSLVGWHEAIVPRLTSC
jgi:hypothetical protein